MVPALEVEDLVVRHGRTTALGGVDLRVDDGEVVALVGPNGSGKTTLLRALGGLLEPTRGRARCSGEELRRLPGRERARRVAYVGQDEASDLPFTAREVVELGRTAAHPGWRRPGPHDRQAVSEVLRRWQLEGVADRALDELSGGERRRVLIARALAQDSEVLLLDEPTNHLDLQHQHALLAHLADRGRTSVAALHDLDLAAAYCSRVVMLDRGAVVADGPPAEVVTAERVSRVYGVRAREVHLGHRNHVLVGR